jgi:hypothetical protein
MTADELTTAGWKFTTRRRKSDGAMRVRAVHKEHGLDMTCWFAHKGATESLAMDAMVREYVAPTHRLLIDKEAA